MQVTVKTLDSKTKSFQIEEKATVKEFKEHISAEVGVSADKQRLIFKGKVLQDEKLLKDYGVDGCVVHLVERQPPPRGGSTDSPSSTSTTTSNSSPNPNVMMNLPADVMGVTQQIVQGIVNHLGADSAQANISTQSSDDGSSLNVHINLTASTQPGRDVIQRLSRARNFLQAATRTINQTESETLLNGSSSVPPTHMDTESTGNTASTQETSLSNSPSSLANLLEEVLTLNSTMEPVLRRYIRLLNDSSTEGLQPGEEHLPDRVAESLHNISHAYHSLSDLSYNFHSPEPHQLNVLPPLSPHTGQHGIPIPQVISSLRRHHGQAPPSSTSQGTTASSQSGTQPLVFVHVSNPVTVAMASLNRNGGHSVSSMTQAASRSASATATTDSSGGPRASTGSTSNGHANHGNSSNPGPGVQFQMPNAVPAEVLSFIQNMSAGGATQLQQGQTAPSWTAPARSSSNSGTAQTVHMHPARSTGRSPHPDPSLPCQSFHFGPLVRQTESLRQNANPPTSQSQSQNNGENQNGTQNQSQGQGGNSPGEGGRPGAVFAEVLSGIVIQPLDGEGQAAGIVFPPLRQTLQRQGSGGAPGMSVNLGQNPQDVMQSMLNAFSGAQQATQTGSRQGGQPGSRPSSQPGSQQTNQTGRDQNSQNSQQMNNVFAQLFGQQTQPPQDQAQIPLIRRIMGDLVSSFSSGSQDGTSTADSLSIGQYINTLRSSGYNIQEEQGLFFDLVRCLENYVSIPQLMSMFMGATEPVNNLRPGLVQFVNDHILQGRPDSRANLQDGADRFAQELFTQTGMLEGVVARDGIDIQTTMNNLLRRQLLGTFELVINSTEQSGNFGQELSQLMTTYITEFVAVFAYCLPSGIQGVQELFRERMPRLLPQEINPSIAGWLTGLYNSYLSQIYLRSTLTQDQIKQHVHLHQEHVSSSPPSHSGTGSKKAESSIAQERQSAGPSSSESVPNTDTPISKRQAVSSKSRTSDTKTKPVSVSKRPDEEAMELDEDEDWKRVVPEEWVPIIARDAISQRHLPPQAPFSDCYLNGMPAKRRKVMKTEFMKVKDTLPKALQNAATAVGVSPKTSSKDFSAAVCSSTSVHSAYEKELRKEVKKRLDKDPDFSPERFPNSQSYFLNGKRTR